MPIKINFIKSGELHTLTKEEIETCRKKSANKTVYKYKTIGEYVCNFTVGIMDCEIKIPDGFLTDGSTSTPDIGVSWLFHDYLYAVHCFTDLTCSKTSISCVREMADDIMYALAEYEFNKTKSSIHWFFAAGIKLATYLNPFYALSKAWKSSGSRGAEFFTS